MKRGDAKAELGDCGPITAGVKELIDEDERAVWALMGLMAREEAGERSETGVGRLGGKTARDRGSAAECHISGVPVVRGEGE